MHADRKYFNLHSRKIVLEPQKDPAKNGMNETFTDVKCDNDRTKEENRFEHIGTFAFYCNIRFPA